MQNLSRGFVGGSDGAEVEFRSSLLWESADDAGRDPDLGSLIPNLP